MVYLKRKARNILLRTLFLVSLLFLSGFRFLLSPFSSEEKNLDELGNTAGNLFNIDTARADTPPDSIIPDSGGCNATSCATGCSGAAAQCNASSGSMSDANTGVGSTGSRGGPGGACY